LPENNHNGNQKKIAGTNSVCGSREVIEFHWPLFVYQRRARDGGEYLFTIAVWHGTRLLPICHLQPFQAALTALGQALITAGQSRSVSTVSAGSDSNGLSTSRQPEASADAKSLSATDNNGQP